MNSLTLQKLGHKSQAGRYLGPTTFRQHKIAQFYSPNTIISEMVAENMTKNFTSILLIGSPGTGKTSLAQFMAHEMHKRNNYEVAWYTKRDVPFIETILEELPPRDHILIFDDVSLALKKITNAKKQMDILEALTEVRHAKDGIDRNIIIISNIHYLMSMPKMWRGQGGWKIYTGLESEDKQNLNQLTGNKWTREFEEFSNITRNMVRRGQFTVALTNKENITYKTGTTKEPNGLRFAMVMDGDRPRYMLYPKEWCQQCVQKAEASKEKVSAKVLVSVVKREAGRQGLSMLKAICAHKGFLGCWSNQSKNVYTMTRRIMEEKVVDCSELAEELRRLAKLPYTNPYHRQDKEDRLVQEIYDESKNISSNV